MAEGDDQPSKNRKVRAKLDKEMQKTMAELRAKFSQAGDRGWGHPGYADGIVPQFRRPMRQPPRKIKAAAST